MNNRTLVEALKEDRGAYNVLTNRRNSNSLWFIGNVVFKYIKETNFANSLTFICNVIYTKETNLACVQMWIPSEKH